MKRKMLAGLAALVVIVGGLVMQGDVDAAQALTSRFYFEFSGVYSNPLDLVTVTAPLSYKASKDLATGVAINQADRVFSDTRTLAPSTPEDLDVSGGALTDPGGAVFTITKLKMLSVCAAAGNTNNVVILGDAASVRVSEKTRSAWLMATPLARSFDALYESGAVTVTRSSGLE